MAKTNFLDIENFNSGLQVLLDPTKAPIGSARVMQNSMISDRGGITKRPGTELLGTENASALGVKGFYVYRKAFGTTELPIKPYGTVVEYYHPNQGWSTLLTGYTSGSEFGFREHLVNTENEDYIYGGNRTEAYFRWSGATTQLNGALAGGETTITVDSTLKDAVFESKTASASSATTLDVANTPWAASQWNNFYVYITSGVHSGKIRLISATTSSQITFATLGSDPGLCTFQIRLPAFPASGTLVVGGNDLAYSAIPSATTFTTSAAAATADNAAVTLKPTSYPAAPRGNRLENHFTRMVVGNVRSALALNASGTLGGSQSTGSYYLSKLKDATNFTYSSPRVASEGDVQSVVFGGGDITDIVNFEDGFLVFKKDYIESCKYSQDSSDIAQRTPIKSGIGSIGKTFKGKDDVYFVTATNEITSISRVAQKDITPQSLNIGYNIKRLLDDMDFTNIAGGAFKNRLLIAGKASSDDTNNNRVLIFNEQTKNFEGEWLLNANGFDRYNSEFYFGESTGANVIKMFEGENDVRGSVSFGVTSQWTSNWMNLTSSDFHTQAINAVAMEGYIRSGTEIEFNLYRDFATESTLNFTFNADDDSEFLSGDNFGAFLGALPLSVSPLGALGSPDGEGYRHFKFIIYIPPQYGNHFSFEVLNSGLSQKFEVTRVGLGLSESITLDAADVKSI